jgi:hypothetical protein
MVCGPARHTPASINQATRHVGNGGCERLGQESRGIGHGGGGLDLGRRATKQSTTPRVPKLGTIFSSLDRLSPYEHRNVPLFGEERG